MLFRSRAERPRWPASLLLSAVACLCGCNSTAPPPATTEATATAAATSAEQLRERLDEVLRHTYHHRHLNLSEHAAWQILHGVLTYKGDFLVEDHQGQKVSAVDYLLDGGQMNGWVVRPGVVIDEESGRRGLQAILQQGSKTGQGHYDQWLAVLAQSDLPPEQEIQVDGQTYTMADFVAQVQWDLPRNVDREYSWTLIGLTTYLPTDATWTAQDGKQWSIEQLVQTEADYDLGEGACGGTHRLIGLSMALNRHLDQQGTLEGPWKLADMRIEEAIERIKQFQNPDGSFSTNYLARPGSSPDLAQNLGATGHTLEFLTLAMTREQLEEPWVQQAVLNLCDLFQKTRDIPLECGALYHAAHGLALYRHRMFGPLDLTGPADEFASDPDDQLTSSTPPPAQSASP